MNCLVCGVECNYATLTLPVGDLLGCRATDVACSFECEDSLLTEDHADGCECNVCWRVARRVAHEAISRHRKTAEEASHG